MLTHLLDTNTCIDVIRQRPSILARLLARSPDELAVSSMTVAELWFGARKSNDPARGRALADAFLEPFESLPFDDIAAEHYARVRRELESRGTPIGERDLIIASIALAHGLAVVTSNTSEFERVDGLAVEDWGQPGSGSGRQE